MERLNYQEQSKKGKRQIVNYIRKTYGYVSARDIIRGLHQVIIKDGKLCGVATDITAIYNERN